MADTEPGRGDAEAAREPEAGAEKAGAEKAGAEQPGGTGAAGGVQVQVGALSGEGDAWRVAMAGEVDLASVDEVRAQVAEVLGRRPGRVVFELGKVAFMDSSGIALILEAAEQATVEVHDPPPIIRVVMETMGIGGVVRITP